MDFSLDDDIDIKVKARLIGKGHDSGLSGGAGYSVKLYDKDLVDQDFLGEARPNEDGIVTFTINANDFGDLGKLEKRPDFYFIVLKNKAEVFRSKVMEDVDIDNVHTRFKMGEGQILDLGTFLVDG